MEKIEMFETRLGAIDSSGIEVRTYKKGSVYRIPGEMSQAVAEVFLKKGWAGPFKKKAAKPKPKTVKPKVETQAEYPGEKTENK